MSANVLCVFCAEVVKSNDFRRHESQKSDSVSVPSPKASQSSEAKEIFTLLNALSANPPRRYEVSECHYVDPDKKITFRVQQICDGGTKDQV